jgi:hypothetical protein
MLFGLTKELLSHFDVDCVDMDFLRAVLYVFVSTLLERAFFGARCQRSAIGSRRCRYISPEHSASTDVR